MDDMVDVDENSERVEEILKNETVTVAGNEITLGQMMGDIKNAHKELDEFKAGALSMSQALSEAADDVDDSVLNTVLTDLYEASFSVYLRLHRGDLELTGERDGEYSGYLIE